MANASDIVPPRHVEDGIVCPRVQVIPHGQRQHQSSLPQTPNFHCPGSPWGLGGPKRMHCPSWRWTCLLRMPERKVQRHTRAQGAERRKHKQWTSTECAFESGHKSCSQILFMDHLAGKAGTKHPTKVPIGSSSIDATKISSERSMEPPLQGT